MTNKIKHIVLTVLMAVFLFGMAAWCWCKPADAYSAAERRQLEQFPKVTLSNIFSGKFMSEFEDYALDQFPARDGFRTLKAFSAFYLYGQKDNNDLYLEDGYISKLEYPLNENSLDRAASVFGKIYDRYLKETDTKVYLSVIPDKNYFTAADNSHLAMDYDEFIDYLTEQTQFARYIDIFGALALSDYYRTDSHWRQESILDVAQLLAKDMGVVLDAEYAVNVAEAPFYGVYYGQSALPVKGETLRYLIADYFDSCTIYDHENDREIAFYDLTAAAGEDPYELFLYGPLSLITIENPNAESDRELIIFRDSFGSSISPFFAEAYSKITLVDIRYLPSERLGDFITFTDQDVLFLYSTSVLNHSETLK